MGFSGYLGSALVFLLATVVAVPLFTRLKLGAVLAYLVAGALVGPHALGLIQADHEQLAASELGVVLLLFLIGLELSFQRLTLMRKALFTIGGLQVAISALLLGIAVWLSGQTGRTALVAGFALAMSSTAVGVQLLAERKALGSPHGRTVLAVLLFQDLVAVPAIALIPLLGDNGAQMELRGAAMALLHVLGALAGVVFLGRVLTRPVFRYVAATRSQEAFTAATLLIALGTAALTAAAGLSMAFGAFLAGVLLADSEFRHEIEASIEPFKGLLLGLFFLGVGMSVDWPFVAQESVRVVVGVVGLLGVKFALLYAIGRRAARLEHDDALRMSAVLAQGGEFAFVLLTLAAGEHLMEPSARDLLTAVVVVSMALTPLLLLAVERLPASASPVPAQPYDDIPQDQRPRVIVAGFGRFGQIVSRILRAQRIPFVALEQNAQQVETSRRFGSVIYYGDPTKPEVLRAAGAEHAKHFVLATDDPEASVRTARLVRRLYPHLKVYARARNRAHAYRLMDLNVHYVVRETLHSSLVMSQQVLSGLGLEPEQAIERVERFRQHDERMLAAQHLVYDDEAKLVQSTHEWIAELEQLFAEDETGQA